MVLELEELEKEKEMQKGCCDVGGLAGEGDVNIVLPTLQQSGVFITVNITIIYTSGTRISNGLF